MKVDKNKSFIIALL